MSLQQAYLPGATTGQEQGVCAHALHPSVPALGAAARCCAPGVQHHGHAPDRQACAGGAKGEVKTVERSWATLSGGERQRVALAMSLAFADVAAQRGRLRCNLLILDEVRLSWVARCEPRLVVCCPQLLSPHKLKACCGPGREPGPCSRGCPVGCAAACSMWTSFICSSQGTLLKALMPQAECLQQRKPAVHASLEPIATTAHQQLCVQVMQNLDTEGCARVADLLRSMPQTTVLLVAQANTPTSEVRCGTRPCLLQQRS